MCCFFLCVLLKLSCAPGMQKIFSMILLRLSGHSCAGKTRLLEALPSYGLSVPKVLRYTSRPTRTGEVEGQDYYFRSRAFIESLPEEYFLVGPVRNMLQAFDLRQIAIDLKKNDLVLVEIYPTLWPELLERLAARMQESLITASVFMTAVDPEKILTIEDEKGRAIYISNEVKQMLLHRNKDDLKDIGIRSSHATGEILHALGPEGRKNYSRIIHSAPEGPDGRDEWTREKTPCGQAGKAIKEFIDFYWELRNTAS